MCQHEISYIYEHEVNINLYFAWFNCIAAAVCWVWTTEQDSTWNCLTVSLARNNHNTLLNTSQKEWN